MLDGHSARLNSSSSDQDTDGCSGGGAAAERKRTLEERMNDMVDAVFGHPKNELLKLIHQRSAPCGDSAAAVAGDNADVVSIQAVDPPTAIDADGCVKHDFQETSSFRPCTCAHCNGLVRLTFV